MILSTILAALSLSGPVEPIVTSEAALCRVRQLVENPDGYRWPVTDVERFVDEADVILLAVAVGVEDGARPAAMGSKVRFRTKQVLSGELEIGDLVFSGDIVEHSDFNHESVPYQMVRPSGQRGECYASEYRIDGEYLFLLKENQGVLTPYWAPLAPTNEEIRGQQDPWVTWVRNRLE
jgi:hypothetical protein